MDWKNIFSAKSKNALTNTSKTEVSTIEEVVKCKNCETEFKGKYCPNCGQIVKEFDRPFSFLIYDFMGTLFAFDARFFKTFKAVLFSPGKFSIDYINGKRASYMKPFQFYVFISFVFFLLLSIQTSRFLKTNDNAASTIEQDFILNDSITPVLNKFESTINETVHTLESDSSKQEKHFKGTVSLTINDIKQAKNYFQKELAKDGHSKFDKRILQNLIKMLNYPDVFISKIYKYFSWSFFLVMPIFGFWLWLFFFKTRKYYSSHFIYSLIAHATTFLFFSIIIAIKLIFPEKESTFENYIFWLIPLYVWLGMKNFYGRSVLRTSFKFLGLSFIYTFSIAITALTVFLVSVYY